MNIFHATLLAMALLAPAAAASQEATADPAAIAVALLDDLDAHDYAAAEARFAPQMAAAVPADKLRRGGSRCRCRRVRPAAAATRRGATPLAPRW